MGELSLVTGPRRLGVGDADEMPRACTVPDERVVVDVPTLVRPDGGVVHTLEGTGKIMYYNRSPDTLTTVVFHLYQNLHQPGEVRNEKEQVTPGIKAHMAEFILKAAAEGQTSYDGLLALASGQIETILSMLS